MGFKGINDTEFVEVLLHKALAGSIHVFSKQKPSNGFWEGRVGSFKVDMFEGGGGNPPQFQKKKKAFAKLFAVPFLDSLIVVTRKKSFILQM